MLLIYKTAALCLGFILDSAFGDPHNMPHIVRLMGRQIAWLERVFLKHGHRGGAALVAVTVLTWGLIPAAALFLLYRFSVWAGFLAESLLCFQLLAAKSLKDESMRVYNDLNRNDISSARKSVSMIVGRDTENLDETGIAKAAVETVAENASDGVVAPMFYIVLGGGAAGCLYKAVNTMDSMIGYKNDKYIYFGRTAAKLDDVLNYLPSRLAAWLMMISAYLCRFDAGGAFKIWRRDRKNHASPNSAQTEAACAGALGVRLGGTSYYFGKLVEKPGIGDGLREIAAEDIADANRLMYTSAVLMLMLGVIVRVVLYAV